jgi:poly(A) polymerase
MSSDSGLRPARTIYNQIRWDPRIDERAFTVGVEDRLRGEQSIPFPRFVPGGRIPWSRVRWFRRGEERVWDRAARVDRLLELDAPAPEVQPAPGLEPLPIWGWDGGRWAAEAAGEGAPDQGAAGEEADEAPGGLVVVSWNVLFDRFPATAYEPARRWAALRAQLAESGADLIGLQEATPAFLEALLAEPWVRERYRISDVDGGTLDPYGQLLLSRRPLRWLGQRRLSRSKRLLLAGLTVGGRPLTAAVVHLTSDLHADAPLRRAAQLAALGEQLGGGDALVMGDFNLDETEHQPTLAALEDAWTAARPDDPGFTFDPATNDLARAISRRPRRRRLDRVLLRAPSLAPIAVDRLGLEALGEGSPRLFCSDHYGVRARLAPAGSLDHAPVHTSALALLLPPEVDAPVQAIRRVHDRRFERWPAHINLLYGFVHERHFAEAAARVRAALAQIAPFEVALASFGCFEHRSSATVWLRPEAGGALEALQSALRAAFPACGEQDEVGGGYHPHLTVGRASGREAAQALITRLEAGWLPRRFQVGEVALLSRRGDGPFEVRWRVPLGGGPARREAGGGLAGALRRLGLGADPAREQRRAAAVARVSALCESAARPAAGGYQGPLVHRLGSLALGVDGPESDLDLLCLLPPELARGAFLRAVAAGLPGARLVEDALVPVLQARVEGEAVDLACARFPQGLALAPPQALSAEQRAGFAPADQRGLVGVLDTAAVLAAVPAARRSDWRLALRALRAWAAARDVDSGAWGYPGGLAWATFAAAALPRVAQPGPEALLEAIFELLVGWDLKAPLTLDGAPGAPEGEGAVQVLTATSPRANIARRSTPATAAVLEAELAGGLERVWHIREGRAGWTSLFSPVDPRSWPGSIQLVVSPARAAPGCAGWLAGQAGAMLPRLEAAVSGLRPFSRPSGGRWTIGLERVLSGAEADALARALEGLVARFERWEQRPEGAALTVEIA